MRSVLPALLLLACNRNFSDDSKDPSVVEDDTGEPVWVDTGDSAPTEDTGETGDTAELVDDDRDGFYSLESGGDDCDDGDPATNPGAPELCDGRDNDCDGSSAADGGEGDDDGDALLDCEDYCPVYAQPGAPGDGRVLDPLGTLQAAVDLAGASGCNEVRAYYGTYAENVDLLGYGVNIESLSGPEATIIDGGGVDSCVTIEEDGDGDLDEDNARVYGFTLTNGGGPYGGGVRVVECAPTIEGNIITENVIDSGGQGGGIRSYNASPTIIDNEISWNDACYGGPESGCDGGAIAIRGGGPVVMGNYMEGNTAGDGGAIWTAYADAWIINNYILGNEADDSAYEDGEERDRDGQGGGIDVQIGGATATVIANNVIADNIASSIGGGLVVYEPNDSYPNTTVANNVIAFNNVLETDWGAGLTQWNSTAPVIYNNAVYGNLGVGVYGDDDVSSWTFSYNDVYGNYPDYDGALASGDGTGNFSSAPGFVAASNDVDWTNDDFRLAAGSALIDAGDPSVLDGDGTRSDVGAWGGPSGAW